MRMYSVVTGVKHIKKGKYTPAVMVCLGYLTGIYYLSNNNKRIGYQDTITDKYPRIEIEN